MSGICGGVLIWGLAVLCFPIISFGSVPDHASFGYIDKLEKCLVLFPVNIRVSYKSVKVDKQLFLPNAFNVFIVKGAKISAECPLELPQYSDFGGSVIPQPRFGANRAGQFLDFTGARKIGPYIPRCIHKGPCSRFGNEGLSRTNELNFEMHLLPSLIGSLNEIRCSHLKPKSGALFGGGGPKILRCENSLYGREYSDNQSGSKQAELNDPSPQRIFMTTFGLFFGGWALEWAVLWWVEHRFWRAVLFALSVCIMATGFGYLLWVQWRVMREIEQDNSQQNYFHNPENVPQKELDNPS